MRLRALAAWLGGSLLASLPIALPAHAVEWGERYNSGGTTVDGIKSEITPVSFGPTPHSCILFDAVARDFVEDLQIESGVLRCGSDFGFDPEPDDPNPCLTDGSNIVNYVETFDADRFPQYLCYFGWYGEVGQTHEHSVIQVNDAGNYAGYIDTFRVVVHYRVYTDPTILIWGEASQPAGTHSCTGWTGEAVFHHTQYYHRGVGYNYFSTFPSANAPDNCWSFGAWTGSTGSAHIYKVTP